VIVFREIGLNDREQVSFAKTLGAVMDQGQDNIYKVTFDPTVTATAEYLQGSFFWHIDRTDVDIPNRASILSARRLSSVGGETQWANTYAAYEDLSEPDKAVIADLRVVHRQEVIQKLARPNITADELVRLRRERPPKSHPLVWTHQSGRKSLVLGRTAADIEGMEPEAGRALLDRLQAWSTQSRYVYEHHWRVGDLVIWDNTGTMHRVNRYPLDSGRSMHRTTLVGEERVA
jgi:alpha-ketoglutarate-dependent taurine dioxygenase